MRRFSSLPVLFLLAAFALASCEESPTSAADALTPAFSHSGNGVHKVPINGMTLSVEELEDERVLITPSGRCHLFGSPGVFNFTGDVQGMVTFNRRVVNVPCDFGNSPGDRLTGSGPFEGDVTFDDRTGMMTGQWTTECRFDPSIPVVGLSCDGVMNARGSGDLEGVRFHFVWGPGFPGIQPLPYTGTASWQ